MTTLKSSVPALAAKPADLASTAPEAFQIGTLFAKSVIRISASEFNKKSDDRIPSTFYNDPNPNNNVDNPAPAGLSL